MGRSIRLNVLGSGVPFSLDEIRTFPAGREYDDVALITSRGEVDGRYYRSGGSERAVIMVGGVGGGYDSPARDLYGVLTERLVDRNISVLRIRYRFPTDLAESTMDVLAGLLFLQEGGIKTAGLIGHSLGGAVVIQAAARCPMVRTIVTLSTQSYGAEGLSEFRDGVASLFIHGGMDPVLSSRCSSYAYGIAKEPKELIVHEQADHSLDQAADEILTEIMTWLSVNLR